MRSLPFAPLTIVLVLLAAACGGSSSVASSDEVSETTGATTETTTTFDGEETAPVEVSGGELPSTEEPGILNDPNIDPAIGKIAPTLKGTNFNGTDVTIGPDGRPKVVYFLAHWCGHCQTEVDLITDLVADGKQPAEIDLYAVAIAVRDDADNYPPSVWLANFPGTVMRDTADSDGAIASGVSGIPYAIYLDGDNTVLSRSIGSLPEEQVLSQWASLVP
ncbi:MAG: TlpA family protein disulfide reductase [Acidimicrobiales bacterium]